MRTMALHLKSPTTVLVTFWTILFSLQSLATTKDELSTLNTVALVFSDHLAQELKHRNTGLIVDLEFYDQRWEEESFPLRHQALALTRRIGQLNAQYQQANQALNSLALFKQQHPGMPALNETARTAQAQAQELERQLEQLQKSAYVKYNWKLSANELNRGKANVDLNQVLAAFKRNLDHGIDLKLKIRSANFLFFKVHLLEWHGDLVGLLEQMKIDELGQLSINLSPDVELIAYNNDHAGKLYAAASTTPKRVLASVKASR